MSPPHRHQRGQHGRGGSPGRGRDSRESEAPRSALRVAELERRGRFLLGEPFFERGRGIPVERDHRAKLGDLVLLRPGLRGRNTAKVVRVIGRPDNARDVADRTWDLVHDRDDNDPVKQRVVECHEALARMTRLGD